MPINQHIDISKSKFFILALIIYDIATSSAKRRIITLQKEAKEHTNKTKQLIARIAVLKTLAKRTRLNSLKRANSELTRRKNTGTSTAKRREYVDRLASNAKGQGHKITHYRELAAGARNVEANLKKSKRESK